MSLLYTFTPCTHTNTHTHTHNAQPLPWNNFKCGNGLGGEINYINTQTYHFLQTLERLVSFCFFLRGDSTFLVVRMSYYSEFTLFRICKFIQVIQSTISVEKLFILLLCYFIWYAICLFPSHLTCFLM